METFSAPGHGTTSQKSSPARRCRRRRFGCPAQPPTAAAPAVTSMPADATQVRAVLDLLRGPVVLCGHSYGGAVITQAAAGPHPAVRRLIYLTGAVPNVGESLTSLAGTVASADHRERQAGLMRRHPARVPVPRSGFAGFRFPPDVIMVAV
ncbi:MAG: alpha/beta hydrolase, partial [Actinomycetota bacterium]|nr:alpha/beta hydrolase [Actinomycetota bacterium]